jgi:hypothetical protein
VGVGVTRVKLRFAPRIPVHSQNTRVINSPIQYCTNVTYQFIYKCVLYTQQRVYYSTLLVVGTRVNVALAQEENAVAESTHGRLETTTAIPH